jgi:S-formylglutathione hydrolase FrmB
VPLARWLLLLVLFGVCCPHATATGWRKDTDELNRINLTLAGQVIDFTANHGKDRRIWSRALCQRRDVYVYLPPGFDPLKRYPLMLWFHGFAQDEQAFLRDVAPRLDTAIRTCKLPPFIAVAPDGSLEGEPCHAKPGTFYINSQAGRFEDFIMQDVMEFAFNNYPIRPERGAHVLAGLSMGGFGAYSLGIRHRDQFGVVVGVYPPLNLRWVDDQGRYFTPFDPDHWGWRTKTKSRHEVIGLFAGGLIKITIGQIIDPIFGRDDDALEQISRHNPIELLDSYHLRPGELEMYVCYGKYDEFNLAAQIESFLYAARQRCLQVGVGYDPEGHHDLATAVRLLPGLIDWLGPRLAPYAVQG